MTLDSQALVSVGEARTYLQVEPTDKPTDELLAQIIMGLSLRIVQRQGQLYINPVKDDGAGARSYVFDPSDRLLEIDACREVTKVEVTATPHDAGSWLVLAADDFILEPPGDVAATVIRFVSTQELPATGQGWGALSLHRRGASDDSMGTPWPWEDQAAVSSRASVRVTGKFGVGADTDSVPANVKLALLMWLQNIHKRDQAFMSEDFGKAMAGLKMPADVAELLDGEGATRPQVTAV